MTTKQSFRARSLPRSLWVRRILLALLIFVVAASETHASSWTDLPAPRAPVGVFDGPQPDDALEWQLECVDCPRQISGADAIWDSQGRLHVLYWGDGLYYAVREGQSWAFGTIVEPAAVANPQMVIDRFDRPHVVWADSGSSTVHYAIPVSGLNWQVQTLGQGKSSPLAITIGVDGFPTVVYQSTDTIELKVVTIGAEIEERILSTGFEIQVTSIAHSAKALYVSWTDCIGSGECSFQVAEITVGGISKREVARTSILEMYGLPILKSAVDPAGRLHIFYLFGYGMDEPLNHTVLSDSDWEQKSYQLIDFFRHSIADISPVFDDAGNLHLAVLKWTFNMIEPNRLVFVEYMNLSDPEPELEGLGVVAVQNGLFDMMVDGEGRPVIFLSGGERQQDDTRGMWAFRRENSEWITHTFSDKGALVNARPSRGDDFEIVFFEDLSEGTALRYGSGSGEKWTFETVVYSSRVGQFVSAKLDAESNIHAAYFDASNGDVKYSLRSNGAWRTNVVEKIEMGTDMKPSLQLDSAGHPHIAYRAMTQDGAVVRYARWTGSEWQIETVGPTDGEDLSLILDSNDKSLIALRQDLNLVMAQKLGEGWSTSLIENGVQDDLAAALSPDGNPIIIFRWDNEIRLAVRTDGGWSRSAVTSQGDLISLALDPNGEPIVSFRDEDHSPAVARRQGSEWSVQNVPLAGLTDSAPALAVDDSGRIHLAVGRQSPRSLIYLQETASGEWQSTLVDDRLGSGFSPAIVLDRYHYPHIAHHASEPEGDLRFAHGLPPLRLAKSHEATSSLAGGDRFTFTLNVSTTGLWVRLLDPLPEGLTYVPDSLTGPATYVEGSRSIFWEGLLDRNSELTVQFQAQIDEPSNRDQALPSFTNQAYLEDIEYGRQRSAWTIPNPTRSYLPVVAK